jgi:hypothetical protein
MEAKNNSELNRVTRRWTRYELIVIDEMAYVAMPETAALIQRCGHIFEAEEALLPS